MPCYTPPPSLNLQEQKIAYLHKTLAILPMPIICEIIVLNTIDEKLCYACQHLTVEQMKSIRAEDPIYGSLLDWYSNHTMDDFFQNQKEKEKIIERTKKIYLNNQYITGEINS